MSNIAIRAAEIIAERGHCKDTLMDTEGRVCHNGALYCAMFERKHGRLPDDGAELGGYIYAGESCSCEVDPVLRVSRDLLGRMPWQWNDEPRTTGEDVILHLKRVGEALEAGE